jgi:hypothetical protein
MRMEANFEPSGDSNRRRLAIVIACALPCVILVAGAALGAGGLSYSSKHRNVSNAEPGRTSLAAKCTAANSHATGGGVKVDGDESGLDLEVGSTLPNGSHNAWKGGANNSTVATAQMTTTAICGKGNYVYKTVKKSVGVGKAEQKTAKCPAGTKVVGGGVGAPGDHGVEVGASEPSDGGDGNSKADDAWLGRESNSSAKRTVMKVTAVCAEAGKFAYVRGPATPVINDTQVTSSVSCPGSTQVTGGGVDVTGKNTNVEVGDSFPTDSGDPGNTPDNGWSASGNNDGSGATRSMRTFAICAK